MRDFKEWFDNFIPSIATYDYYVNFESVYENVAKHEHEFALMNTLIGKEDIEEKFKELIAKYPETLKCVPILLAVRNLEIYAKEKDDKNVKLFNFNECTNSIDEYVEFMWKTGLFELLKGNHIKNVVDYITGVEVGMDTNARKSRSGHLMEDLVQDYIEKAGYELGVNYFKEMKSREIEKKWGIDLSPITNNGKNTKRFDYVIKTDNMVYGIEVNFYNSNGSKPNETARSYKTLAVESKEIEGFTFVWFTDGAGWFSSSRNNLEETWTEMNTIYNIDDLNTGIIEKLK